MERKDFNASLAKSIKAGIDKHQATIAKNNLKEQKGLAKLEKTLGGQDPALTGAGGNLSAGSAMTEVPNLARAEKCGPKIPKVMKKMGVLPGVEGGGTFDGNSMSSPNNTDGLKASEKKMAKEEISPIKEVPMTRLVMPEKVKGAKDGSEKIPKAIETDKSGKIDKGKELGKGAMIDQIKTQSAKAGVPVKAVLGYNIPKALPKVAPYPNPDFTNPGKTMTKATLRPYERVGYKGPNQDYAGYSLKVKNPTKETWKPTHINKENGQPVMETHRSYGANVYAPEKLTSHIVHRSGHRWDVDPSTLTPIPSGTKVLSYQGKIKTKPGIPVTKAAIPMTSGPGIPGRALSSASKLLRDPLAHAGRVKLAAQWKPTHTIGGKIVSESPPAKGVYRESPAGMPFDPLGDKVTPLAPSPVTKAEPTMAKPVVKSPSSAPAGKVSAPKPTTNLAPKAPKL